jgi:pSer/pThr/pTyr-binding forkhead associated (FHA) protein
MSKKAADRYASAHALAEDLRRFRSGHTTPTQQMPIRQTAPPSVLLIASKSGKQVRLHHPTTVIGRASECDLVIKSSHVSKKHCQILLQQDGSVRVEDLGSANGICVNGDPVRNVTLKDGDTLDIAGYAFEVRFRKSKKA